MLEMVITARAADLGHGLKVRRVLPYAKRRMVGPWIFVDHAGPVTIAPEDTHAADVRPHPHIGLSTVSYLLSGQIHHRDSLGVHQLINPGDVNWMTAGRGISHSERFKHPDSFAGGGLELAAMAATQPGWHFTGVDPSPAMLDLAREATAFAEKVKKIPNVVDVESSVQQGLPAFAVKLKPGAVRELGLTAPQLASSLRESSPV